MRTLATSLMIAVTVACSDGPTCGNGRHEDGEACDGDCPVECDDGDPCTVDLLIGNAEQCSAECAATPLDSCVDDDGCCPANCEVDGDSDCMLCSAAESPAGLRVSLPTDEGAHTDSLEWWYWTGHLQTDLGRWFGFQVVVFLSDVPGMWGQVGHLSITDIDGQTFQFASPAALGRPHEVSGGYRFSLSGMSAEGDGDADILHGELTDYVLDLAIGNLKSPVYQYGVGYVDYPFGGNTYYYSREGMQAAGTLKVGADELTVTGSAWFDHQWGELSDARDIGWDWFALQLDDGDEIMIANIRSTPIVLTGSSTDAECNTTDLDDSQIVITPTGAWTSPHTGRVYPSGWDIAVLSESYHVEPAALDQELYGVLPGVDYWEGACTVSGSATGRAYVELTGY